MFLKSSTRKTRRGNVIKTVKEHYLRSDISCGLNSCSICKNSISIKQINASNIKFLVPDENTLFNNIDLFEHKSITHVILLQSVLDALSSTSIHIYNRVRVLAADVSKSFYVFSNEFHCDTFIPFNRTISNRVNLSIIKAVEWYSLHLNKLSNNSSILIISTNQDLITEATSKTIPILPVLKYIESFNPIPELLDIVASATPPDQIKFTFPPHLSTLQVNSGIKSGLLLQGVLNVNPNNYLDASIFASITENGVSVENKIIINGSMGINRAVHGDVVAVELLPKEEWKSDDAIVIQEEDENQGIFV